MLLCLIITSFSVADTAISILQGEKMVMVACGWRHTISISSNGSIYTHGWSKYGQLGHGDFEDCLIPHKLEALQGNFISQVNFVP